MKKHSKLPRLVLADELMDRWKRNRIELAAFIRDFNLPAYRFVERETEQIDPNSIFPGLVPSLVFNLTDVERFENEHPELLPKKASKAKSLTPEEARELGRLREGMLFAELDLSEVARAKFDFDVVGHYARPDVFQLVVNERPAMPVVQMENEKIKKDC